MTISAGELKHRITIGLESNKDKEKDILTLIITVLLGMQFFAPFLWRFRPFADIPGV